MLLHLCRAWLILYAAFQVLTLLIFGGLATEFYRRYRKDPARPTHFLEASVKNSLIAVVVAYSAILIRCIYRIAEMAGGWANPIMQNQPLFVVLDGVMCVIACIALASFHPGAIFQKSKLVLKGAVDAEVGTESGSGSTGDIALEKKVPVVSTI